MTKIYVILISAILYTMLIFGLGWHYELLRITAKEEAQTRADIVKANQKLLNNNKVETAYDRTVTVIDNSNPEVKDEKIGCSIPDNWLHFFYTATH